MKIPRPVDSSLTLNIIVIAMLHSMKHCIALCANKTYGISLVKREIFKVRRSLLRPAPLLKRQHKGQCSPLARADCRQACRSRIHRAGEGPVAQQKEFYAPSSFPFVTGSIPILVAVFLNRSNRAFQPGPMNSPGQRLSSRIVKLPLPAGASRESDKPGSWPQRSSRP